MTEKNGILFCTVICFLGFTPFFIQTLSAREDEKPSVVRLVGSSGEFRLTRNGEDYFIRGAGGNKFLDVLAEAGGNSIRTWGIDHADTDLDNARKHGLTVTLGYWMGHERHGFDYTDKAQTDRQAEEVRRMVQKFKDHPALLVWGIGNEVELQCKNEDAIWRQVDRLAELIHELDPNHPVMTVVAEISEQKVKKLHEICPAVDVIGINSYGGAASVGERWRKFGATKPYILTEFGPIGHWETGKGPGGAAIEVSSTEKCLMYAKAYESAVEKEKNAFCLGSYAFLWGWKMEGTPTWFGMFLPDGSRLGAVETMEIAWKGKLDPKSNRVPRMEAIKITKTEDILEKETVEAGANAKDPDGDPLQWNWTLIAEVGYGVGGDAQEAAPEFPEAIVQGQGTSSVQIVLPGAGVYRLYAYVRDGQGNAAYTSKILHALGDPLKAAGPAKIPGKKISVPCPVYTDGDENHWTPSGYMGNPQAIKMDLKYKHSPHSGKHCIRAELTATEGWAGVLWQSPANDWGARPGGFDLSSANTIEFWARGKYGGETVSFQVGALEDKPYPDSFPAQKREVVLKKEWTRYRIALDGLDLTRVKTGFGWVVVAKGKPTVFYLDDIRFTRE